MLSRLDDLTITFCFLFKQPSLNTSPG